MGRCRTISQVVAAPAAQWASYALCLLIPLSVYRPLGPSLAPQALDTYVRPGLYLSDLAVAALLLTSMAPRKAGARGWGAPRLTLPLLALVGLAVLTIPTALSPALAAYTALRWLAALGVYLSMARGDVPLEGLVIVFLVGLGVHVLVGLGQAWLQSPLGLPGEMALEPSQSGAAILEVGGTRWLRAYGLTFHPNVLGGFLTTGLLLGLPLLTRSRMPVLWWLLWFGLLITFSRSAWLAMAVVMPLALCALFQRWLLRSRPMPHPRLARGSRALVISLIGAALIAALWLALFSAQLTTRLRPLATPTERRSIVERGVLQAASLDVIRKHRLAGVGAGNVPLAMLEAAVPFPPQPAHNLPLLLAAEVGFVGGGLWLWLWLAPGMALIRHWQRADPWAVALISAWLALGVIGLWDGYPWALNAGRLLSATLLGLVSRAVQERQEAWSRDDTASR